MKGKKEFEDKFVKILKDLGYVVFDKIHGSRRQPDLIAIKGKDALVIETKSWSESKNNSWLSTYKGDYLRPFREKCKSKKIPRAIAKWIFTIQGQLKYYLTHKKEWYVNEAELSKFKVIPCLAFPAEHKTDVIKASKYSKLKYKSEIFDKKFCFIKFFNL